MMAHGTSDCKGFVRQEVWRVKADDELVGDVATS